MTSRLNIGGLSMVLEGHDSLATALHLPGMNLFADQSGAEPRLMVRLDADVPLPDCRWLHRFTVADDVECRFGVDARGDYYYHFSGHGTLRAAAGGRKPDAFSISPIASPSVLRFALWTAYSMGGLWLGRLPVHSSVVVCDGRAVMCLGESGTGKSTHTRLWLQHIAATHLLNDDSPILADDGTVYGSPWSGKTHCYRNEHFPVAAIVRLEQRPENRIRPLGTVEAFTALQPSCPPCLMKDDTLQDALVDYVGHVIERVPVYRLGCLPDAEAARLCHTTIFKS